MRNSYTRPPAASQLELVTPQNAARIVHARQDHILNTFALALLKASCGDPGRAEVLLDNIVDTVASGGVLQTWAYRLVLAKIRGYPQ